PGRGRHPAATPPPRRGRGNFGWGSPRPATPPPRRGRGSPHSATLPPGRHRPAAPPPGWGNFGWGAAAGRAGGGAGRRDAPAVGARRAGDPAAQPPRLRHLRPVPRLRERVALPAVQRRVDVPPRAPAARLPLLLPRGAPAHHLRPVRL